MEHLRFKIRASRDDGWISIQDQIKNADKKFKIYEFKMEWEMHTETLKFSLN